MAFLGYRLLSRISLIMLVTVLREMEYLLQTSAFDIQRSGGFVELVIFGIRLILSGVIVEVCLATCVKAALQC